MHHRHQNIPANLRRIAAYVRTLRVILPDAERPLDVSSRYLENVAFYLQQLGDPMGRVADTINRLESEKDQLRAQAEDQRRRADALQQQIDTQQTKLLDDQDLAALDRADQDAQTPANPGTPTTGTGDTTTPPATTGGDNTTPPADNTTATPAPQQ